MSWRSTELRHPRAAKSWSRDSGTKTLKRFVKLDERHVELRPESNDPEHQVMKLDLAMHRLEIDGVAVGALLTRLEPVPGDLSL
jgi:hypothetical protein